MPFDPDAAQVALNKLTSNVNASLGTQPNFISVAKVTQATNDPPNATTSVVEQVNRTPAQQVTSAAAAPTPYPDYNPDSLYYYVAYPDLLTPNAPSYKGWFIQDTGVYQLGQSYINNGQTEVQPAFGGGGAGLGQFTIIYERPFGVDLSITHNGQWPEGQGGLFV